MIFEYDLLQSAGELLHAIDPFWAGTIALRARGSSESSGNSEYIVMIDEDIRRQKTVDAKVFRTLGYETEDK